MHVFQNVVGDRGDRGKIRFLIYLFMSLQLVIDIKYEYSGGGVGFVHIIRIFLSCFGAST